jgi:hypothetical protein
LYFHRSNIIINFVLGRKGFMDGGGCCLFQGAVLMTGKNCEVNHNNLNKGPSNT